MKKITWLVLTILTFFCNLCFAEIVKTNDIGVIENNLASAGVDTLVIFDIDDVLMYPNDAILQPRGEELCAKLVQQLKQSVGKHAIKEFISIILLERSVSPVDPRSVELLAKLQQKNIKTLALTNCLTGKFGLIENTENLRIAQLKTLGYHFNVSWQHLANISLKAMIDDNLDANPVYKDGVVFVDQTKEKGPVLGAFLKYAKFKPRQIIFVDDKLKNLHSVERYASSNDIKFTAIQYTKSLDFCDLNQDIARLQFKVLEQQKKWLSDKQAAKLLQNK